MSKHAAGCKHRQSCSMPGSTNLSKGGQCRRIPFWRAGIAMNAYLIRNIKKLTGNYQRNNQPIKNL